MYSRLNASWPGLRGRRSECDLLDRLVEAVCGGKGRALVVRGERGVGKTALLDYVAEHASSCRVARVVCVQSEMELSFAGLHQVCAPMLGRLQRLPVPQRAALRVAFGLSPGSAPDRFLVGLAVLSLLADAAEESPLICLVDDEQWLDRASAQVLGFVARRLAAKSVGLVFAARVPGEELRGLPELLVEGLGEADARAVLEAVLIGPLDARVRDRIIAETRGNPLTLVELAQGLTPAELAGGFALPDTMPLSGLTEESFRRRLEALPADTRTLLLVAAAEPVGDPVLVWQAAEQLGISTEVATPAAEAGLLEVGARVRFRHPLVRSVAYRSASLQQRQDVHRALAAVTNPEVDPDRRAWHLAQAASGPDEDVASDLERSAGRAQARGGFAAAAAFLERAAMLTPEPGRRAQRGLSAASAKRGAGALDAALGLLVAVEAGPLDALSAAEVEHLRGLIALVQRRPNDAARLLLSAARRLEPLDTGLARDTHLDALWAALWAGHLGSSGGVVAAAEAARAAPPGPEPPRAVDVLLDAFALRLTQGFTAAAPTLTRALELSLALDVTIHEGGPARWLAGGRASCLIALELWDTDALHALAAAQAQVAREAGAPVHLQYALNFLATAHLFAGELTTAARLVDEDRLIADVTENPPVGYAAIALAAWQGREAQASELIDATSRAATTRGLGRMVNIAAYASAVLYNGLGRHDVARDAVWRAFERDDLGNGPYVVPELAEAASRTGDTASVRAALEWLSERTRTTPSEWSLGMEARLRALLSQGDDAERHYRESIDRLSRTSVRVQLARAYLLYGEWLRRRGRRRDARAQLSRAHELLDTMGIEAFAERARRELLATGEKVRKRNDETRDQLTPQELQIARLARDGLSNQEIAARLYISPRTVEWHLHKVFAKLDVASRKGLGSALVKLDRQIILA